MTEQEKSKLTHIGGRIAAAAFVAKTFSNDEALSKLLLEVVKDLTDIIGVQDRSIE